MNQQEKKIDQYLKAVARRLNMPGSVKTRVLSDLRSSILGRMEAGQTVEEVLPKAKHTALRCCNSTPSWQPILMRDIYMKD